MCFSPNPLYFVVTVSLIWLAAEKVTQCPGGSLLDDICIYLPEKKTRKHFVLAGHIAQLQKIGVKEQCLSHHT